tara:strand:+ start:1352 stop:2092 length:741 start_codon:yes stop_codon:yes gene_type:complete
MRTYKVNKITHKVYEDESELPPGINVLSDWRDGKVGDWIKTDDHCFIQVLRRGQMLRAKGKKKIREYIGTCTGTFPIGPNVYMDTGRRTNIYSFSGEKAPDDVLLDRTKLSTREHLFVTYSVSGLSPGEAYLKAFPTKNARYAMEKGAKLIKTKRVAQAMKEELKPVLEELGIDDKSVLKDIRDVSQSAEKEDVRLRALFKLSDILDLEDKTRTNVTEITGGVFKGFSQELLEEVKAPALPEKKDD